MAKRTDHVIVRDGSAGLGGPRPDPPARPASSSESPATGYFNPSGDPQGVKGSYSLPDSARVDIIGRSANADAATFEAAGGGRNPVPRHELPVTPAKTAGPFVSAGGGPMPFRNVQRRGIDEAVARAKLDEGKRAPTMHDLRHTFASLLIAQGLDVVYISRQLGHASPATTPTVYASEFDRVRHAETARAALSAQFGGLLGNAMETATGNSAQEPTLETAVVTPFRN